MRSVRVVVAGFGPIYRTGLSAVLPTFGTPLRIAVIAEAGELRRSTALIRLLGPDVILTDLSFPGEDRSPARRLRAAHPAARLLVLAPGSDRADVRSAFDQGATGYVLQPADKDTLLDALQAIVTGDQYLDPRLDFLTSGSLDLDERALSDREQEVLQLLALGYTNSEVAARLVISVRTVETHRSNIQRKLGVRSRAELARAAFREGIAALTLTEQTTTA